MKGATVRLRKNGVCVKTFFVDSDGNVAWDTESGKIPREYLVTHGWEIVKEIALTDLYRHLDTMWNKFCYGKRLSNNDFLNLRDLIDRVNEYE